MPYLTLDCSEQPPPHYQTINFQFQQRESSGFKSLLEIRNFYVAREIESLRKCVRLGNNRDHMTGQNVREGVTDKVADSQGVSICPFLLRIRKAHDLHLF